MKGKTKDARLMGALSRAGRRLCGRTSDANGTRLRQWGCPC
jgi:hypothetical protein